MTKTANNENRIIRTLATRAAEFAPKTHAFREATLGKLTFGRQKNGGTSTGKAGLTPPQGTLRSAAYSVSSEGAVGLSSTSQV